MSGSDWSGIKPQLSARAACRQELLSRLGSARLGSQSDGRNNYTRIPPREGAIFFFFFFNGRLGFPFFSFFIYIFIYVFYINTCRGLKGSEVTERRLVRAGRDFFFFFSSLDAKTEKNEKRRRGSEGGDTNINLNKERSTARSLYMTKLSGAQTSWPLRVWGIWPRLTRSLEGRVECENMRWSLGFFGAFLSGVKQKTKKNLANKHPPPPPHRS